MSEKFQIRRMTRKEVEDIAVKWAANEGWNPGLRDGECFYAADPNGFLLGELDGRPVSAISAVAYDKEFAFMGIYIVKPELRGKGFGMRVWRAALEYLGGRNIGGDGVLERIDDYRTQGFKSYYKNSRYRGIAKGSPDKNLTPINEIDFKALSEYDDGIFPAKRHDFLRCWISRPETIGYGVTDKTRIKGYGIIRPCFKGHKIGPLFADDHIAAEKIFNALVGSIPKNDEFFFDVPEVNAEAVKLAEKNRLNIVFQTARIYSKYPPKIPLEKIYGVTSFELG